MSGLEARIAEVIAQHQITTGMQVASGATCRCGAWSETLPRTRPAGMPWLVWHQSAMLAPVIAEAKAEALREAADEVERIDPAWDSALFVDGSYHPLPDWLRTRADNLEAS